MLQPAIDALRRGQTAEALAAARAAVDAEPDNPGARHLLGLAQRADGDREAARTSFERAVALAPENATYHLSLAALSLADRDLDGARRELDDSVGLDPNQLQAYLMLAHLALARGDRDEAERQLRLAQRIAPEHPHARVVEGQLLLGRGDHENALRVLTAAAKTAPGDALAQSALGLAYLARGSFAFAEQAFRNVLAERPEMHGMRRVLVETLRRQGRLDEALAEADALVQAQPDNALALTAQALLAMQLGRDETAIDSLQAALAREPGGRRALDALLALRARRGEGDALRAFLDAQLERRPDAEALWSARVAFAAGGEDARAQVERWHAARPGSAQAAETLALLCEAAGEGERAEALAQTALALQDRPAARLLLYRAEVHRDPDAAQARLAGLADHPDPLLRTEVRRALGHAHDHAGRRVEAVAEWRAAQAAHPRAQPYPAPGALPETIAPPAATVIDAPILLWGAPGTGVHLPLELLRRQIVLPLLGDRYGTGPNVRIDGFTAPQTWLDDPVHPGKAPGEFARLWRHGAQRYGVPARTVIDCIPFWDARLLPPLHAQLPGTRLVAMLRDPRDALLDWLAFGASGFYSAADVDAAALALAAAYEHLAWTQEQGALPLHLIRYEGLTAAPVEHARALADFVGLTQTLDVTGIDRLARDVGGHPRAFAPGRWRDYAQTLEPAFERLTLMAYRFGYGD